VATAKPSIPQLSWDKVRPAPVILVSGTEGFLADRAIRQLRDLLRAEDPSIEVNDIEADQYTPGELISLASPSLFNEPRLKDDAASWQIWKNGGPGVVGHQQLVNEIRATGATNVLVAEGLRVGKSFKNSPLLSDPLGQMAYGIHPYLNSPINDPASWDGFFGYLTATDPVIATEWNATSESAFCQAFWPTNAPIMLSYLKSHGIGLWAWGLDFPNTLIVDWTYKPTDFVGFTCGVGGDGAGAMVKNYFQTY
jgi:hypothetical protein